MKCSKELDREDGAARKRRKTAQGRARRQIQSNLLDGIYPGAKDLMSLCIETLARNVDIAESLGDLPAPLVDRLAGILSKKRMVNSTTFNLFLRPGAENVTCFDGAKLSSDDYIRIFQIVPTVKHLRLRNAVQFKNIVMDHLLGTVVELKTFSLYGANLIDDDHWNQYLETKGSHLTALKIYHTDGHFGDKQVELLPKACPKLQRLKISHNQQVTDAGITPIGELKKLEHLSWELYNKGIESDPYIKVIENIGKQLRTLSLSTIPELSDSVLDAIHNNCRNIFKLRLTDNHVFTDQGFARLFTNWKNPPLIFVDLHKCRHIDASQPRTNTDGIGFASTGFKALMEHSGSALKYLNVHSCRHISLEAFEAIFAKDKIYPELLRIDFSFCQSVNDFVVGSIFRSCPKLKTLKVFGNFGVKDVRVPKGRILIGVPNAMGMQIEGTEDGDGKYV
jgi:DNA repair protein RAD7